MSGMAQKLKELFIEKGMLGPQEIKHGTEWVQNNLLPQGRTQSMLSILKMLQNL